MSNNSLTYPCVKFRTAVWGLVPTFLNNFARWPCLMIWGVEIELYIMRLIKIAAWNTVIEIHMLLWSHQDFRQVTVLTPILYVWERNLSWRLTCQMFLSEKSFAASVPAVVLKGCLSRPPRRLSIWEPTHPTTQLLSPVRVNLIPKLLPKFPVGGPVWLMYLCIMCSMLNT
jgi:hypothetical protein